jgi:hypothetical protein
VRWSVLRPQPRLQPRRLLKRYGLIVADNGSPWFITGAPNPGWNDANLEQIKRVPGSEFEAVESGPILHG